MTVFLFILHALSAVLLITVILMQSGRGGGLTESFASAESMFGAKTNQFMVRTTVVLASLFLVTSLTLAHLSAKQGRSLMPEEISGQQVIPIDLGTGAATEMELAPPAEQPAEESEPGAESQETQPRAASPEAVTPAETNP